MPLAQARGFCYTIGVGRKSSSMKSKEDKMRIEKSKNSDMWFVYSNGIMIGAFANLNGAKDYCRKLKFRMRDVVIVK